MAYSTIKDPSAFFQVKVWTGNSGSNVNVVNDGNSDLQPDLIWAKERTSPGGYDYDHNWIDSSRGVTKTLWSNSTDAEKTASQSSYDLQSFNTDGFTTGAPEYTNSLGGSAVTDGKVAWQWKANGGTTSTNSDGDINSTVQVNQDAGFSIVTYQPSNTTARNIGHGLGVTPGVIIIRNRTRVENWRLWHYRIGTGGAIFDNTSAYNTSTSTLVNTVNSTIFNVGSDFSVNGGYPIVAWCWAEKQGYSKFGKYVGTSSSDGPFVYTGFKPAWIMIKRVDAGTTYSSWAIFDHKRVGYNPVGGPQSLYANRNYGEGKRGQGSSNTSEVRIDMLSNGFKVRDGGSDEINDAADKYIYMAFAENPFVANGIPTTAR